MFFPGLVGFGVAGCKSPSITSHGNRRLAGTSGPPSVLFFAYSRGGFHFYIGWRDRGNFGVKLDF